MTAPINGFRDLKKFYKDVSCCHYMEQIKIPTLFIHSLEDPVCVKECIPFEKIVENENCILVLTQRGGHIEYLSGNKAERWAYIPALEYLNYQA